MNLTNYSEFGLVVTAISVANGWLDNEWLIVLALAMSFSFVIAPAQARPRIQVVKGENPCWELGHRYRPSTGLNTLSWATRPGTS